MIPDDSEGRLQVPPSQAASLSASASARGLAARRPGSVFQVDFSVFQVGSRTQAASTSAKSGVHILHIEIGFTYFAYFAYFLVYFAYCRQ